ncbi:28542_t:CDS:2, partial [Gigaspora margarita]
SRKDESNNSNNYNSNNYDPNDYDLNYKLRGMAYKHIFSVCQKYYLMPAPEVLFLQEVEEPESKNTNDIFFEDWVSAIHKVWDKHN